MKKSGGVEWSFCSPLLIFVLVIAAVWWRSSQCLFLLASQRQKLWVVSANWYIGTWLHTRFVCYDNQLRIPHKFRRSTICCGKLNGMKYLRPKLQCSSRAPKPLLTQHTWVPTKCRRLSCTVPFSCFTVSSSVACFSLFVCDSYISEEAGHCFRSLRQQRAMQTRNDVSVFRTCHIHIHAVLMRFKVYCKEKEIWAHALSPLFD